MAHSLTTILLTLSEQDLWQGDVRYTDERACRARRLLCRVRRWSRKEGS